MEKVTSMDDALLKPKEHDLIDILMGQSPPFVIRTTAVTDNLGNPQTMGWAYPEFNGLQMFPWLDNTSYGCEEGEYRFPGIFTLDRPHNRILFFPHRVRSQRDSYRAAYGKIFYYPYSLEEMIRAVEQQGIPLFQACTLKTLALKAIKKNPLQIIQYTQQKAELASAFTRKTSYDGDEAYQIDGSISLDQICNGQFLPVLPFPEDLSTYLLSLD